VSSSLSTAADKGRDFDETGCSMHHYNASTAMVRSPVENCSDLPQRRILFKHKRSARVLLDVVRADRIDGVCKDTGDADVERVLPRRYYVECVQFPGERSGKLTV
jgi:hypothetical protein